MINNPLDIHGANLIVAGSLLLFFSTHVSAVAPNDNWYAGGPDGGQPPTNISETWHLKAGNTPNGHIMFANSVVTLVRAGNSNQWLLEPDDALDWTPKTIHLESHPDWILAPGGDGWRWISTPPVGIKLNNVRHHHDICIGFPDVQARKDKDEIFISVVDAGDDCGDPSEHHPGHSAAGR
jgi:hypothetical protein